MRKIGLIGTLMLLAGSAGAATSRSPRTINKVMVAAVGRNSTIASTIEDGLRDRMKEHGVLATTLHGTFSSSMTAVQMRQQLTASGYDAFLCITPRKTIQISVGPSDAISLNDCLSLYASGTLTADPLDTSPTKDEDPYTPTNQPPGVGGTSLKSPIPSSPGGAPVRISKSMIRLYDVRQGSVLWAQRVHVKVPAEARISIRGALITSGLWDALKDSGAFQK